MHKTKIAEFMNNIDEDVAAHFELPILNLCCPFSGLRILDTAWTKHFRNFADINFVISFFDTLWVDSMSYKQDTDLMFGIGFHK